MPQEDYPKIFGLNSFINTTFKLNYYKEITRRTLESIENPMLKIIEDNEFSLLNSIENLQAKLPPRINNELTENFIISEEIRKNNMIISKVFDSLNILKDCISGNMPISPEYVEIARNILDNEVPKTWSFKPFRSPMNLSFFMADLKEKVDFFQGFNKEQIYYWIGAFSSPKALIYQLKRDFSRRLKNPLQEIRLTYKIVNDESLSDIKNPVLTGLRLLGAKWDKTTGKLCENLNSLYDELPAVTVYPEVDSDSAAGMLCYDCPIYQNLNQDLVIDIMSLPTDIRTEQWKKRNVKLFCENIP